VSATQRTLSLAALVAVGLAGLAAVAALWWPRPEPAGEPAVAGQATVVRVIDGDTVVLDIGGREEPTRLIGIDTPESVAPDRPVECFGPEASARLEQLLPPGTVVRVSRDLEPRDAYDRLLAYVHRDTDDLFVNLAQVADGYAATRHHPPNTAHRDELDRAEQEARQHGRGLWSACSGPTRRPSAGVGARASLVSPHRQ
jgi:micrococcal nuclease